MFEVCKNGSGCLYSTAVKKIDGTTVWVCLLGKKEREKCQKNMAGWE
jgi:hypothetical protein